MEIFIIWKQHLQNLPRTVLPNTTESIIRILRLQVMRETPLIIPTAPIFRWITPPMFLMLWIYRMSSRPFIHQVPYFMHSSARSCQTGPAAAKLVKTIADHYKLPYYTLSPTYSICAEHGYLAGEHNVCPVCGKNAEVYSRITGYYRPVQNWNEGKTQEYKNRTTYNVPSSLLKNGSQEQKTGKRNRQKVGDAVRHLFIYH